MSYQVLARKWRPHIFSEVVGQEHVVHALCNALNSGRLHHAYLFSGTRGVGKTTLGRIMAKSLNCESGVSAEPCGQCSICREIEEGRFVDLIEIDAASRTKVEDTREILDNVQYRPTRGRYKVYLIDEVHMLSRHSFNALLKTLEEPPEHVKFLLATTDPQKLPVTILSRCLQFNLKALSVEQISGQLQHILGAEQIDYQPAALQLLARAARGSMRDALSLADQAVAHGQGQLTLGEVTAMLGMVDRDHVYHIVQALLQRNADAMLDAVANVAQFAPDYDKLMSTLLSLFHRASLACFTKQAVTSDEQEQAAVAELTRHWSAPDLQLAYQLLVQGRRDLPYAPDGRTALEMALLRVILFEPVQAVEQLPAHTAAAASAKVESNKLAPSAEEHDGSELIAPVKEESGADVIASMPSGDATDDDHLVAEDDVSIAGESIPVDDEPVDDEPTTASTADVEPEPEIDSVPITAPTESAGDSLQAILSARSHLRSRLKALDNGAQTTVGQESAPVPTSQVKYDADVAADAEVTPATTAATSESSTTPAHTTAGAAEREPQSEPAAADDNPGAMQQDDGYYASLMADELPWSEEGEDEPDFFPEPPAMEGAVAETETPPEIESPAAQVNAADTEILHGSSAPESSVAPEPEPILSESVDAVAENTSSEVVAESSPLSFWEQLIDNMGLSGLLRQIALDCALVEQGDGYLLQVREGMVLPNLDQYLAELVQSLKNMLGQQCVIDISRVATIHTETPRAAQQRRDDEALVRAKSVIAADPNIKMLQEQFAATVVEESIRPV